MFFTSRRFLAVPILAGALLAGCGGGGDSTPAPAPAPVPIPQGAYAGTLTGSANKNFELLMLENNEVWSLYGTETSTVFGVTGFVQGTGSNPSDGKFTSINTKDFGFSPAVNVTTVATYDATAKTISGTVSSPATGVVTFSGGPIPGSLYDYNKPAVLKDISGDWSMTSLVGEDLRLTVAPTGTFVGNSSAGCRFTGTIVPRPSGKNVFNVSLSFGAAPCALPFQSASGIALAYPLTTGQTQLIVSVVDATRTYGTAVFGVATTAAPTPIPEGVYGGTLAGSASKNFELLMLDKGELWSLYGTDTSTAFSVAGFVQGVGAFDPFDGKFTSTNTKDFGFSPAVPVTTVATYNAIAKTVSGTVSSPATGVVSFSGGPIPGSLYDYNKPAVLSTIAGSWSLNSLTGEVITLVIGSNGQGNGYTSSGCNIGATFTPRPSGKNVFNVSLIFQAAPCALPFSSASGIAVAYPLANGQTQLIVSVFDSTRTYGTAAFGVATTPPPPASTAPIAAGVYGGTLAGSVNNNFELLMHEGTFWSLYGTETSTEFVVSGFVQGAFNYYGGIPVSDQYTKDYGFSPAVDVKVIGNYNATANTISGTVSSSATGVVTFSGGPIPGSLYDYNKPASNSTIVGNWTLRSLTGESIALAVNANGSFQATSSLGCKFSGGINPSASGKNVFDFFFTYDAAPCAFPYQQASGIALAYPLASGKTQLIAAAVSNRFATPSYGTAAFGTR